jgi:hypothetical protein
MPCSGNEASWYRSLEQRQEWNGRGTQGHVHQFGEQSCTSSTPRVSKAKARETPSSWGDSLLMDRTMIAGLWDGC